MKNDFEIRGLVTAVFIRRKDGVNLETLIDTEDLGLVKQAVAWYAKHDKTINGYYVLGCFKTETGYRTTSLHRYLLRAPKNRLVDHVNLDTLKNTRENLRLVTKGQSNQNQGRRKDNTSGFKGVSWVKHSCKYRARVQVDGKLIHLGMFEDPKEAAKVAAEARSKLHPFSKDAAERRSTA